MKQVKCTSCDGVGNHGLDKRGQRIGCRTCHATGEMDHTPEDLQKLYPLLCLNDIEHLTDRDLDEDVEELLAKSDTHVVCLITNRDGEVHSVEKLAPSMDAILDLQEETSSYEGEWGGYHSLRTIVYQRKSFRLVLKGGAVVGNGADDISTVLGAPSLTMAEVRAKLEFAAKLPESALRSEVQDTLSRMRSC